MNGLNSETYIQQNINQNGIMSFVTTWIDLEGIMPSEINQTEKDKYHMTSLTCGK